MCGLLAYLSLGKELDRTEDELVAALNLMEHRGPDDSGTFRSNTYWLGHRRLSILDLSHDASQPMVVLGGKVKIVFNGEIYNFQEIRKDLESRGYTFHTHCDTEVILNAYLEHGKDCVDAFNGMFAFVIVDERFGKHRVMIARDRLGIKPLYFFRDNERLIISSEIKAILPLAKRRFRLNRRAVSSYLSFRYPIGTETFFDGIECVPASTRIMLDDGKEILRETYWEFSSVIGGAKEATPEATEDYLEELDHLLSSSVAYRQISDVPVGAFLSGGVDSSLITALMAKQSSLPVKTFTIGFDEEGFGEFEYANIVRDQYATEHKEILLGGADYFSEMKKLIRFKDAPLSVPNEVPLYLMSKELKKDITVVLSGEGADEIFGGYGRIFRSTDDYLRIASGQADAEFKKKFAAKYRGHEFHSELDHFYYSYCYTKPEDKMALFSGSEDWEAIEHDLCATFEERFKEAAKGTYLDRMMYTFERDHLQGLLYRADTSTMSASVEARVPFVDHRLVRFAFSLPAELKLRWNSDDAREKASGQLSDEVSEVFDTPKYLLKKYGERHLPDSILYRRKQGFPVPLNRWFGGQFKSLAAKRLSDSGNLAAALFDPTAVSDLVEQITDNKPAEAMRVWMLMNLFEFCSSYSDWLTEA